MLSMIAVIGKNRELGKDNGLLWHIPGDLARFKQITSGHPVIMGRKTFQSIGKPLPNRTNIIITSGQKMIPGIAIVHSLEAAIDKAKASPGSEEIFVIGGGSLYAQAIAYANRLYLTLVDKSADADTFFPDYSGFVHTLAEESREEGGYRYRYVTLTR